MKLIGVVTSMVLIASGIYCFTMAALGMGTGVSGIDFLFTLVNICLWTAIPVIIFGVIYLIYIRKTG
ncbi:hypothetical protein [Anaeroselena agilis]|uniref:Uncharacterized protein n=1 Tax=Anaeroselena agilis TaxID=3063788 RepID=A0ABU3NTI1_9FIRM|nr:hypothetical protein [Selenomonadales bacterium 4137-cl]